MKAELTLNEKSLLYGALTILAFLGIAAILYFYFSKRIALISVALSIPAGLIAGLMPYWCAESSYGLSDAGVITTGSESQIK